MKLISYVILFFTCLTPGFAQTISIYGSVADKSGKAIPYVNIGIKGKKSGTISDEAGQFKLEVPDSLRNKKLTFSCVGFIENNLPISSINGSKQIRVVLEEKVFQLGEIEITDKKRKVSKLGITGRTPFVYTPAESYGNHDIIEQARLISIQKPAKVLSANVFLAGSTSDSIKIRLNFYHVKNDYPDSRIIEKSIIKTFYTKNGWLTFDLTKDEIYMNTDFVVSFEYLPNNRKNNPKRIRLFFGSKMGAANSYSRNSSQGLWTKQQGFGTSIYVTVES